MLKNIDAKGLKTHMPFLIEVGGKTVLFFCFKEEPSGIWKIYYCVDGAEALRLTTGREEDETECSPTLWHDNTGYHISFIAGGGKKKAFYLYEMHSPDLISFSTPQPRARAKTGFIYKEYMAYGLLEDDIFWWYGDDTVKLSIESSYIYRVSYKADQPSVLLISGEFKESGEIFSLEYGLDTEEQYFLECDGHAAYKCAFCGDKVLFTCRDGDHFEDRKIHEAHTVTRIKTNIVKVIKELP